MHINYVCLTCIKLYYRNLNKSINEYVLTVHKQCYKSAYLSKFKAYETRIRVMRCVSIFMNVMVILVMA